MLANKANIYYVTNRFKDALPLYDKVLEFEPNNKIYLFERADTLLALGKTEQALEAFKKAIKMDSNYCQAIGRAAICLLKLKRYEESIVFFNRAIKLVDSKLSFYLDDFIRARNEAIKYHYCSQVIKEKMNDFHQLLLRFE